MTMTKLKLKRFRTDSEKQFSTPLKNFNSMEEFLDHIGLKGEKYRTI